MSVYPILIYEKNLDNKFCHVNTVRLDEFDDIIYNTGYTYSGLTLTFPLNDFTPHFDTTGHTYNNVILNNDVFAYTGLTGETHYFVIHDFYSGGTISIDPLLTGFTESEIISGFTTPVTGCTALLSNLTGVCCPTEAVLSNIPWVYQINHGAGADNCSYLIQRRPISGWTIDFIFNRNGLPWSDSVFFYEGVRDEYDPKFYLDNNLSFRFTPDGRIRFEAMRYTGYCDTVSGYTESSYLYSGQTFPLCPNGTSGDFNITISFQRYYTYVDCELPNEGGWNDLIHTGITSTTGSTMVTGTTMEVLSNLWLKERYKRLGVLKIYLNGRPMEIEVPLSPIPNFRNVPVYHFKNWEEVVLSNRGNQPFTHAVGGGVTGSGGIHDSVCCYSIKYAAYFEDPMQALYVRDRYLNTTKPNFNITECWEPCVDNLYSIIPTPSPTPSISVSPSVTPSITPSLTPSISISPTPSETPTPTPTPSTSPTVFGYLVTLYPCAAFTCNSGSTVSAYIQTTQTLALGMFYKASTGDSFSVDNVSIPGGTPYTITAGPFFNCDDACA